jgi:hypothetical protein
VDRPGVAGQRFSDDSHSEPTTLLYLDRGRQTDDTFAKLEKVPGGDSLNSNTCTDDYDLELLFRWVHREYCKRLYFMQPNNTTSFFSSELLKKFLCVLSDTLSLPCSSCFSRTHAPFWPL